MTTSHFFLTATAWTGATLTLEGEEARHCAQVTRHGVGAEIVVFDGVGRLAEGRIVSVGRERVSVEVVAEKTVPRPQAELTLVQGIVKGDTMEWILEKAVELGVQRILPVLTQRSIVRLSGAEALKKQEKWQRVILEACKQCGQAWLPVLSPPCTLPVAVEQTAAVPLKLTASLQTDASPSFSARAPASGAALAIGPEGDFTPEEYAFLKQAGWQPWSLGALTLRSETAAICALSILGYECRFA